MPGLFRYLARWNGRLIHTTYTPEQTAEVQRLLKAGMSRDAIASTTGINYSSLTYAAELEHLSRTVVCGDCSADGSLPSNA